MSGKYLGDQFDIHTGGADLRSVHHNNEIAQSECSTGCSPYVSYWMHGEMLNFGGEKLSKSTGGNITLKSLKEKNINLLAYRYLAMQTHYRSPMNFTWDVLNAAQKGLEKVYREIIELRKHTKHDIGEIDTNFKHKFESKIYDDINIPQALAVFHTMMNSDISARSKLATAYNFDQVLGLGLSEYTPAIIDIPENIQLLLTKRKQARDNKDYTLSDDIRNQITDLGYKVLDIDGEQKIEKL